MNSMKRQKEKIGHRDELPRSVGTLYTNEDQWRNNSRKNEETESKQKQHPAVDVTGDVSEVQYCWQRNVLKSRDKTYFYLNERIKTKNKTVLFCFLSRKVHGLRESLREFI